jgi:hypothetical protein
VQNGTAARHGRIHVNDPNGPYDRTHVDLTGPHSPSLQGSVYIMTAIDAFTRYMVAVPIKNKTALTVANALLDCVCLPFGCVRSIVTDQGTKFCNEILER